MTNYDKGGLCFFSKLANKNYSTVKYNYIALVFK